MRRKWVLAVDPGETCGFAWFSYKNITDVVRTGSWEYKGLPLSKFAEYFRRALNSLGGMECVVVEDYVIYAASADFHIGRPLVTSKLIGVIEAVCALQNMPVKVISVPAAKKGRWPEARIRARLPRMLVDADSEHVKDAIKLGLAYIEGAACGR